MLPIKVAISQLEIIPGKPELNTRKIIQEIENARERGDDLIVFPEMAIPGYLLGDEWENEAFVRDCHSYNEDIREATRSITAVWGNIDLDPGKVNEDGRIRKYNAAFAARDGLYLEGTPVYKTLMPKYREFDDERHFYSSRKLAQDQGLSPEELIHPVEARIEQQQTRLGIILCEDMWSDDYTVKPIEILLRKGVDILLNLSCSPWTWRKNDKRHRVIKEQVMSGNTYFLYCNNVGIQNNGKNIFLFDGNSSVYSPGGKLAMVARDYQEETIRYTLYQESECSVAPASLSKDQDNRELYQGLIFGIRQFFRGFAHPNVVIGLSGGIDSALSCTLLARALGPENVYAVNMPTRFNSGTTRNAALTLARNLGIHYTVVPIEDACNQTILDLESTVFERLDGSGSRTPVSLSKLNKENVQARDRGSRVLAGISSALGAVFVNNGNKTETALGYATLYGDVNGAMAPIADLYKLEVYSLARYINSLGPDEVIPGSIFEIPASAELSEDQNVDEGKGDPIFYPYHDKLVKAFVEFRLDPEDILRFYLQGKLGEKIHCDEAIIQQYFSSKQAFISDLEHKWNLFKINYFKRVQAPPIIAVSKRAFGFDLREAQNGVHYTREYERMKKDGL